MDNNIITTIQELLTGRNSEFDKATKIKLVRHKENKATIQFLDETYMGSLYHMYRYDHSLFLKYQSHQATENFSSVEYIVSFIGESGQEARFVGVYKNCGHMIVDEKTSIFDFQEVEGFEILNERVILIGESLLFLGINGGKTRRKLFVSTKELEVTMFHLSPNMKMLYSIMSN